METEYALHYKRFGLYPLHQLLKRKNALLSTSESDQLSVRAIMQSNLFNTRKQALDSIDHDIMMYTVLVHDDMIKHDDPYEWLFKKEYFAGTRNQYYKGEHMFLGKEGLPETGVSNTTLYIAEQFVLKKIISLLHGSEVIE